MRDCDKKNIKEEAKKIMDKFGKALEEVVKKIKGEENFVEREVDRRIECHCCSGSEDFKKIMFRNAKKKDEDFIFAETKNW